MYAVPKVPCRMGPLVLWNIFILKYICLVKCHTFDYSIDKMRSYIY